MMEARLWWIGVAMGLYAYFTRYGARSGRIEARGATAAWHGLFCALAAFSLTLIAVMSFETRARFQGPAAGILSLREFYPSLLAALAAGGWGSWRAWSFSDSPEGRRYYHDEDLEWAETVFSAFLLAAVLMYCVVQAFKIPSGSMRETLLEGDHLFVNKFVYGVRVPLTKHRLLRLKPVERGDIVVFRFPGEDEQETHCGSIQYDKDFIKRVIGLPGDEVALSEGRLLINGKPLGPEPYAQQVDALRQPKPGVRFPPDQYQRLWEAHVLDKHLGDVMRDDFGPVRVPAGAYFVMGDNRDRSCDSRFWGPVPDDYVKGRAWLLYWPPRRMGTVR